jgi:hypothetical protein
MWFKLLDTLSTVVQAQLLSLILYMFLLYIVINLTDIEALLSVACICESDSLMTLCFKITRQSYVQFSIGNSCNLLQDMSWSIIEWYLEPISTSISMTCLHHLKGILAGKLTSHWPNTTHDVWQHCWPKWQAKRCVQNGMVQWCGWWAPYPLLIYDYSITSILYWCHSPCSYHSQCSSFYLSTPTFDEDNWSWQCCIVQYCPR